MTVINMDCIAGMRCFGENTFDSIVTDPPYELTSARPGGRSPATEGKVMRGFMGMQWDGSGIAFNPEMWAEALRVLKPGGHLLAFSGSRTYHRMACAIEDAGFEIRDQIMWVYGSGFPKSLDVSKAIDKAAGAEREIVGRAVYGDGHTQKSAVSIGFGGSDPDADLRFLTAPASPAARQWQGWGTALKPAHEPICVARKPLVGTVAANVLAHGTGAINVEGCRVPGTVTSNPLSRGAGNISTNGHKGQDGTGLDRVSDAGRWPANLIHDGSDEVLAVFPQTGVSSGGGRANGDKFGGGYAPPDLDTVGYGDKGSAARFFYCAKASKADREAGLDDVPGVARVNGNKWTDQDYRVANGERSEGRESGPRKNHHPTVKPTELMRYLCRLVTPPGGTVLDPFAGSGSTGKAAALEGFKFIGFELSAEYTAIANARINHASL